MIFSKKNPIPGSTNLICEINGLKEINKFFDSHQLLTPKIIRFDESEIDMEHIESTRGNETTNKILGINLAKMHKITQKKFGFHEDNYIGLNKQKNTLSDDWGEFFITNRLLYQIDLMVDEKLKQYCYDWIDVSQDSLKELLNQNNPKPSLLHGDLWGGNVLFTESEVYLIDPAVYYGDREVDIAMSELFGRFSNRFYDAYQEEYPLNFYYEKRKPIYNLYHQINHFNLFGNSYRGAILSTIKSY